MNKLIYIIGLAFAIILIIIISYIVTTINNKESFKNDDKKEDENKNIYMTAEETIIFIRKDPDNYVKNLSKYDIVARNMKNSQDYIDNIINQCYNFSERDMIKINKCSAIAKNYFDNGYKWKFALVGDIYEEGMPHTRTDIIFLSPKIVSYDEDELTKILIHESVHIYQRYNNMNKYLEENRYKISRRRDSELFVRANPDLDEYIYIDRNGNELFYKYKSSMPSGINDVIPTVNEHPFEVMAYKIAEDYGRYKLSKYINI